MQPAPCLCVAHITSSAIACHLLVTQSSAHPHTHTYMLTSDCPLLCVHLSPAAGLSYAPPTGTSSSNGNGNGVVLSPPAPEARPAPVTATVTVPANLVSSSSRDVATAAAAAAAAPVAARTLLSMEEDEMTSDQIQCRWAGGDAIPPPLALWCTPACVKWAEQCVLKGILRK